MNWVTLYALLKKKINEAVGLTNQFVDELPEEGESGKLYFVNKDDPQDPDQYYMYVWDSDNSDFVLLDPDMDLSIYAKTADLANVATSGSYNDLSNTPNLANVATSGSYNDLEDKPTIPDELADLQADSTHRLVTDTEKGTWNDKTKVTVNPTVTSDIKTKIAEVSVNNINKDIYISSGKLSENSPYVYRQSCNGKSNLAPIMKEQLIGGSVVWNQYVDTNTESVTIPSGHKYILWNGSALSLATSDGTAVSVSSGNKFYDITLMFPSAVANTMTTEKFAILYPNYANYAYSAPIIQSTKVSSKVVKDSDNQTVATYDLSGSHPVTRKYEYRAYASGDESLPDTITDGTNTVTKRTTPITETVTNPTLYGIWKLDANNNLYFDGDTCDDIPNPQIVENGGTEEFIDAEVTAGNRDVSMPCGGNRVYYADNDDIELMKYYVDTKEDNDVPINGVIYYDGATVPEGYTLTTDPTGGGISYIDLTGVLTAGETTLTLTSTSITSDSTFDYYTSVFGVNPVDITVSTGSITLTFDEQSADLGVKVRIS